MTSSKTELVLVEEIVVCKVVGDFVEDQGFEDFADRVQEGDRVV